MELIDLVNSVIISNDRTQMVSFSARSPDCNSHSPALLGLFLSFEAIICSTLVFPRLENSDHVVVSVSIDFPLNSQRDATLYHAQLITIFVLIGMVFVII